MKKYAAVGHWDGNSNTTSVADFANSKAEFAETLRANGFRAYTILTEKKFNEMKEMDCMKIYEVVSKVTPNYRKRNDVTDYIEECGDIIESKLANVQY